MERPNRLAADAEGDTMNRTAWFDGKTATAKPVSVDLLTQVAAAE